MNHLHRYKNKDKKRAYKNRCRLKNYKKGRAHQVKQTGWLPRETAILYIRDEQGIKCDREIAMELGRSVQAIQDRRHVLSRKEIPRNVQDIIDYFKINGIPEKSDG
jgi:hypothetical protein